VPPRSAEAMGARILVVDDSPTIRKVVTSILEKRAYEALTAEDGLDALQKLEEADDVDLVLLDFVMPRMNGYQFCRELRAHPERKNVPVVLMSAKGDRIRGQFVQQTGAIDAITKPFDARGLIAVVEGALKKHEEGRGRPVPDSELMPDEETVADSLHPSQITPSEDPAVRRLQTAFEFGSAIAKLVVPELCKLPDTPRGATEIYSDAIQNAITAESMGALSSLLRTLDFGEDTHEVLSGDISVISIAEILQLLHLQHQSGALTISTRKSEVTLFVREGNIDFARSRGVRDEFLLGRYLVESGAISREDLDGVLAERSSGRKLLGDTLKELGLVEPDAVTHAVTRQTSELVFEVVRWKHGRFIFTIGIPPEVSTVRLGLSTSALVMEGFRRVDEWRLIEGTIDFEEVLAKDVTAIERLGDDAKLTQREEMVLDAIDGESTVREIVDSVGGSSFEICKIFYQLVNSRLVRRKATD
jgi:CheY-like chemotaxis protein